MGCFPLHKAYHYKFYCHDCNVKKNTRYGRKATWIEAYADTTYIKVNESLVDAEKLLNMAVLANQSFLILLPVAVEESNGRQRCFSLSASARGGAGGIHFFYYYYFFYYYFFIIIFFFYWFYCWFFQISPQEIQCFGPQWTRCDSIVGSIKYSTSLS